MSTAGYIVPIGGAEEKFRDPAILARFVELCGGKDARIAVIPTASQLAETGPKYRQIFSDIGSREPRVLNIESRADADDPKTIAVLDRADAVFMTGGNQLRLSTTLGGTAFSEKLLERHSEGMHVGGTSAGAAILSEHMIAFGDEGPTPRADMGYACTWGWG